MSNTEIDQLRLDATSIAAGGNWIVDRVKVIDVYPAQDALANILSETSGNGGSPYNILKALAKIGYAGKLQAIGLVGEDADGQRIREDCDLHRIDASLLRTTAAAPTSYTDVMSVQGTGRRTFFHQRGANALLRAEHFDFDQISAGHLHLGYLLLLDGLDELDEVYGTAAARVLAIAKGQGMTTSIDVVSEDSGRFHEVVLPALRYVDVAFMNEFELSRTAGLVFNAEDPDRLQEAGRMLAASMAGTLVVHSPRRAYRFVREQLPIVHGSVQLPQDRIQGTVGAGDAFAAGYLSSFLRGNDATECLRAGVCVAASCLLAEDCSTGILPWAECLELGQTYGFHH